MKASSPHSLPVLKRPHPRESEAFTLIEVTLAIGIVAFAFVALFGLLPIGMTNFRQALDTSLTTQIAQRIINDLKQSDFDTVAKQTGPSLRYYSEQGDDMTTGNPGSETAVSKNWLYYGEITVGAPDAKSPPATALPGAATPPTPNLLTIVIRLAANPARRPNPFAAGSKVSYRTYTTLIARNQ